LLALSISDCQLVPMHGATDDEPICPLPIRCPARTDWQGVGYGLVDDCAAVS
jgi:hypothetical protein